MEIESFAKALDVHLSTSQGGGYVLRREAGGEETEASSGRVWVEGQILPLKESQGAFLVSLDEVAGPLGLRANKNREIGTIDVSITALASRDGPGKAGASGVGGLLMPPERKPYEPAHCCP